ncbi:MAG: hypothetical protein FJ083_09085 [Cyanobacteria bacterium K_Offshore_surface_m2_239]|nr:hypothetical protein [Cyanobacteria bacterium K_Offshore_surface_m2_239]
MGPLALAEVVLPVDCPQSLSPALAQVREGEALGPGVWGGQDRGVELRDQPDASVGEESGKGHGKNHLFPAKPCMTMTWLLELPCPGWLCLLCVTRTNNVLNSLFEPEKTASNGEMFDESPFAISSVDGHP